MKHAQIGGRIATPLNHTHRTIEWGVAKSVWPPVRSAPSSAVKLPVTGVGKRPKEDAGAAIYGLTNVHGDGENDHEKEEIDAKERAQ